MVPSVSDDSWSRKSWSARIGDVVFTSCGVVPCLSLEASVDKRLLRLVEFWTWLGVRCLPSDFVAVALCVGSCEPAEEVVFYSAMVMCATVVSCALAIYLAMCVWSEFKASNGRPFRFCRPQSTVMNPSASMGVGVALWIFSVSFNFVLQLSLSRLPLLEWSLVCKPLLFALLCSGMLLLELLWHITLLGGQSLTWWSTSRQRQQRIGRLA